MMRAFRKRIRTILRERISPRCHLWLREEFRDLDLAADRIAAESSAAFLIESAPLAVGRDSKFLLLNEAMKSVSIEGLICEFGVYTGETINHISSLTSSIVHGFDSFEGLPEEWRQGVGKGAFHLGQLPAVRQNVELHKGLFSDSLPLFLEAHPGNVAFLHIDCDLYSSTRCVFELLRDRIVAGTVIQFDELLNYPGWQQGEMKAFREFCAETNCEVEWLGYVKRDEQVLARVKVIGGRASEIGPR
jgi:hypothetical protein